MQATFIPLQQLRLCIHLLKMFSKKIKVSILKIVNNIKLTNNIDFKKCRISIYVQLMS